MRDLKKDKEISDMVLPIKPRTPSDFKFMEDAVFYVEAREGWPHAIERAIKAEAEAGRLRENLCGACESLTQATGHGWKDTCCNCEWYKTDRVTRESEGE